MTQAHEPRGTESDSLMVQVDRDNVLGICSELRYQVEQMYTALETADRNAVQPPCGDDPVSIDAARAFDAKIEQIRDVHWAHLAEIERAIGRLREAAAEYGFTNDDIEASFKAELPGMQQRHADVRAARAAAL
ncbi:PE domain-containing protein [Pseudonocardia sp. HH130630-07]|uniref:PE domain-containing protein n=1 Tax=Pseudonocardia sp. HH130630-07 TaxID=1690815 RepID=UPI0008152D72|nr:PE domain-containing protein [Pseudonocardia sp. HH130630-07]ANY05510.1 hypothetical protein AFB00_03440 [Pseudonocardia sp. HH130630-07]